MKMPKHPPDLNMIWSQTVKTLERVEKIFVMDPESATARRVVARTKDEKTTVI